MYDMRGKYVLVRCANAGVHCGYLVRHRKDSVVLAESRRLWRWRCADGIALSGVAQHGLSSDGWSKVDTLNPVIALNGAVEIIPMTDKARDSVLAAPANRTGN
jgi:hypothetical protein